MLTKESFEKLSKGDILSAPSLLTCAGADVTTDFKVVNVIKGTKNGKTVSVDMQGFFMGVYLGLYGVDYLGDKKEPHFDFYEIADEQVLGEE